MEVPLSPRKDNHRVEWIIWGALAATIFAITAAFLWTRLGERLEKPLINSGYVPDFALTNQFGQVTALSNLLGHVWVADVIFTRCPVSCMQMSRRMKALQDEIPARLGVRFVSLTADPGYDTPSILGKYASGHGADGSRWFFLTGIKRDVYKLGIDGLKFTVLDKATDKVTPDDLFIHSTHFVVIDKSGQIRGYFEGTDENERKQLAIAIRKLARERP